MWDPSIYLRYGDERGRPFGDLLARVGASDPREVVDLGCGPGTLTVGLRERWPNARILGVDSSAEMIASAAALGAGANGRSASSRADANGRSASSRAGANGRSASSRAGANGRSASSRADVEFKVTDVYDWSPGPAVDVVLSNALLQWVPGHPDLLRRWVGELGAGRWLAFQVPGNFDAPSHRALREVAARPRWRERVAEGLRDPAAVLDPAGYAQLLTGLGCHVDAWETTYLHLLPVTDAEHPVVRWMEGTAMRPARAALADDAEWSEFRAEVRELVDAVYPARNGVVAFPFRRIFVVTRTA